METENENENQLSDDSEDAANLPTKSEDDYEDNLVEILEAVPKGRRAELLRLVSASESHSGWLPSPKYLRQYEAILPGLAERIVAMPEREQAHRHKIIEKVVKDDRDLKSRGQIFALASLVLLVAVSTYLIAVGQYAWGSRIAIFGVIGVVGIFVTGKWADSKHDKAGMADAGQDDADD